MRFPQTVFKGVGKMTRKPLLFLKDILNAIERIETYTRDGEE